MFKINDDELLLMRDMFELPGTTDEEACNWFIKNFGLEYIILTGGATFSTIIAKDGEVSTLHTPHVEVADTVGAGDSFSGAFLAYWLRGFSLRAAHERAVEVSAFVCTQQGAWPEYPAQLQED